MTVGGGAVRFPIEAGGALEETIEAPTLDVVRGLDARTNIGYAVETGAASDSEPEVHEDYVSAYDLGRFAESAQTDEVATISAETAASRRFWEHLRRRRGERALSVCGEGGSGGGGDVRVRIRVAGDAPAAFG